MADKDKDKGKGNGNGRGRGGRGGNGNGNEDDWDAQDQSAYDRLSDMFAQYGLSSLIPYIKQYIIDGLSGPSIQLALSETPEYKQRFQANELRKKLGLAVLKPAEIVALETSYKQQLANYGLPEGFYDSPDDFANWIAGDVSPAEVARRAQLATDKLLSADTGYRQALKDYYGVGDAEIVAFFLDKEKAQPILEKQAAALEVGAAAYRQGLDLSLTKATDLIDNFGVDQSTAQQGFGAIADVLPDAQKLADIDKVSYTQDDAVAEVFKSDAAAAKKRKGLASRERARFSGSGGANQTTLTQSSSGQY